jgi:hypothetical protein
MKKEHVHIPLSDFNNIRVLSERLLQNLRTGVLFWVVEAKYDVYFAWTASKRVHISNYNMSEAFLTEIMDFVAIIFVPYLQPVATS